MPGLKITQWGPAGWNVLHAIAHTQPDVLSARERARLRRFLEEYAHYLPCRVCSRHFAEFVRVRATDDALSTRDTVVRLLHDAHNDVNIRTGKPKMSFREHLRLYSLEAGAPSAFAAAAVATGATVLVTYLVGAHYVPQKKNLRVSR